MESRRRAVLGFGNPVREDDAVGIYTINSLREQIDDPDDIEIIDMGTSAFEVLFKLKEFEEIVLVDAVVNSGEPVGTVFKLPAEAIEAQIVDDPLVFLHSLKWDQALSYAKKMLGADYPASITVFLIAIESTRFNTEMTEQARVGADRAVDALLRFLNIENRKN